MGQDLPDHLGIFDAGDDPDLPTAGRTGLDVDAEHALQALRLRLMAAWRCGGVFSRPSAVDSVLLPLPRFAGVTTARCLLFGANTPWNRVYAETGTMHSSIGGPLAEADNMELELRIVRALPGKPADDRWP